MNFSIKYFFNRALELLHKKTFDTYRLNLHNPYTIFDELHKSIDKFNKKKIKYFDPTVTSIGEESKSLIDNPFLEDVFSFGSFSKKQASDILEHTCIKPKDSKRNRTLSLLCKTISIENKHFNSTLADKILNILNEDSQENLKKLDTYTSWYMTQLIHQGYSRKYINGKLNNCLKVIDKKPELFDQEFKKLQYAFSQEASEHQVIYKIKTNSTSSLQFASSEITEIDELPVYVISNKFINERFKEKTEGEKYLSVNVQSYDFWSALRSTLPIIAESIEVNVLHGSENRIHLENQAVVNHFGSSRLRILPTEEVLDGFYNYKEAGFTRFINNFQKLEPNSVAREKMRSAIRFYKLGNDSIEIEHKILNYWIGFEQLFSSVDTEEDSIKRIKTFFIAMNSVYYWQRRVNYLLESVNRVGKTINVGISDLNNLEFSIDNPLNPLLKTRLAHYIELLNKDKEIKNTLERHEKKLGQHLTRIYRLRNELVHEGKSTMDLILIAGHLKHYLIFSIEQLTNELMENPTLSQLDDVFVYFENLLTRMKSSRNILELNEIKEYNGYME